MSSNLPIRDSQRRRSTDTLSITGILGLSGADSDLSLTTVADSIRMVAKFWPLFILSRLCLLLTTVNISAFALHIQSWRMLALTLAADCVVWIVPHLAIVRRRAPHVQMRIMLVMVGVAGLCAGIWRARLDHDLLISASAMMMGPLTLVLLAVLIFGHQRLLSLFYCAGLLAGLMSQGDAGALVPMGVTLGALAISTLTQARFDGQRLLLAQKEEERGRRARLLLAEYEDAGRGWFWETDRRGALTYISDTLAQSLGLRADDLIGRPLTDLVVVDQGGGTDLSRTLSFYLSSRSAFSDVSVRVGLVDDERWWAMSGCPIINEFGQFFGFRGNGSDLTATKRSEAEVAQLARYDVLTGLANRGQMQRLLAQSISGPGGHPGECALFLIDLDRFKNVNDTLGHPAGDALLREVADRLRRVVGERGVVGRLGGDEFKVVLPRQYDRNMLGLLADAIIASLSHPYTVEGKQVVIGASVGIALCPDDGVTSEELVRNADLALYAAKGDGRGVYRFYSAEMLASAEDRRLLEADLRDALASGGLRLVYQPVVSARTERITGFETLLRWDHPTRGAISPAMFVPVAEDAGLIGALGEWVMRTACDTAATWPENVRVAVNVSPLQFANPNLPAIVMNALASSGLTPERLELEITESAFIHEGEATDHMFSQLKGLGIRLALDDFGTGYSSLGYLRKAPFDKIKIDQSFVRGAAIRGSRNAAIITSIVNLAEALGMDTTAEGVETHDELALVRTLGCSQIQGYIYGRGFSEEEVNAQFEAYGVKVSASGFQSSRPPRRAMLRSVALRHGGQSYVGRIRNISSGGAMIEGLWNVPHDTVFQVELAAGMTAQACTRWSVEDRIGVQFVHPIDLRQLNSAAPIKLAG